MDWYAIYKFLAWSLTGWLNIVIGFWFAYDYLKTKTSDTIYFTPVQCTTRTRKGSGKMPVAVITVTTKRYELKTLPEGYVVVRRMNYGEKLLRAQLATKFLVGGDTRDKNNFQGEVNIETSETALWDFANLIMEHNLTDENENLLNFKNRSHVQRLAGHIGEEIGTYIDEWNDVESSEETKNS